MFLTISVEIPEDLISIIGQGARYQEQMKDNEGRLIDNPESVNEFLKCKFQGYAQGLYEGQERKTDRENQDIRLFNVDTNKALITANLVVS